MILPEKPRVELAVGGRPIAATGQFVLGRHDSEVSITLDDLVFRIAFVSDVGEVSADAKMVGPNEMRIRFTGTIGNLPVSYELGGVATWNGVWLDLAMMITAVDQGPVVHQVTYTFTASEVV